MVYTNQQQQPYYKLINKQKQQINVLDKATDLKNKNNIVKYKYLKTIKTFILFIHATST